MALDIATSSTIQVHSLFLSVTCLLLFGADHRAQQLVQLPINVVHFIIYKTSILMDKSRVWEHNAKMSRGCLHRAITFEITYSAHSDAAPCVDMTHRIAAPFSPTHRFKCCTVHEFDDCFGTQQDEHGVKVSHLGRRRRSRHVPEEATGNCTNSDHASTHTDHAVARQHAVRQGGV